MISLYILWYLNSIIIYTFSVQWCSCEQHTLTWEEIFVLMNTWHPGLLHLALVQLCSCRYEWVIHESHNYSKRYKLLHCIWLQGTQLLCNGVTHYTFVLKVSFSKQLTFNFFCFLSFFISSHSEDGCRIAPLGLCSCAPLLPSSLTFTIFLFTNFHAGERWNHGI